MPQQAVPQGKGEKGIRPSLVRDCVEPAGNHPRSTERFQAHAASCRLHGGRTSCPRMRGKMPLSDSGEAMG